MADEDEDKGWLRRQSGYPSGRSYYPKMYSSYRNKNSVSTAFKTETIRVPETEAEAAYDDYMRQYPPRWLRHRMYIANSKLGRHDDICLSAISNRKVALQ